jgi:hypothetical protein
VTLFERKGTQVQNWVVDYTFQKPSSATAHFIAGPDTGVTIEWNGGATVQAHRGRGLFALFKKTLSLHDPQVTTVRGSSLDQLSFGAFLTHEADTPGSIAQSAAPGIPGIPSEAVTLIATSAIANTGLTREVIEISSINHLPTRVLGYEGTRLVRQIDFADVIARHSKLNAAIGSRCAAFEAG